MSWFTTLFVLAIAYLVSWFSARAAGRLWTESKIVGGMPRVMVIGSLVLSTIGFTGVYFMLIMLIVPLFSSPFSGMDWQQYYPLSWGVLGAPGVGFVPNMWLNQQVTGRRQQMLGSTAVSGGILPIHPMDALNLTLRSGGLWGRVTSLFEAPTGGGKGVKISGKDSGKLMMILLLAALAVLALCAGVVTTILIVQSADREHVGEIYDLYQASYGVAPQP
jgi:hypothetical protein